MSVPGKTSVWISRESLRIAVVATKRKAGTRSIQPCQIYSSFSKLFSRTRNAVLRILPPSHSFLHIVRIPVALPGIRRMERSTIMFILLEQNAYPSKQKTILSDSLSKNKSRASQIRVGRPATALHYFGSVPHHFALTVASAALPAARRASSRRRGTPFRAQRGSAT